MKKIITFLILAIIFTIPLALASPDKKISNPAQSEFIKEKLNNKNVPIKLVSTFLGFEIGTVAEYSLIDWTEQCLLDCNASGRVTLYEDGRLFDDVLFKDNKKNSKSLPFKIYYGYNESYTEQVVDTMKKVCYAIPINATNLVNETCTNEIATYKDVVRSRMVWKEYNGETLRGNYEWAIYGKKQAINENIDFIPVSYNQEFSEWAWWNSTWQYKKKITINESFLNLSTIKLIIPLETGKMNETFKDVRFTNANEDAELAYNLFSYNATAGVFYVKVWNSSQDIYMYYGNVNAVSTSSESAFNTIFLNNTAMAGTVESTALGTNNAGAIVNVSKANVGIYKATKHMNVADETTRVFVTRGDTNAAANMTMEILSSLNDSNGNMTFQPYTLQVGVNYSIVTNGTWSGKIAYGTSTYPVYSALGANIISGVRTGWYTPARDSVVKSLIFVYNFYEFQNYTIGAEQGQSVATSSISLSTPVNYANITNKSILFQCNVTSYASNLSLVTLNVTGANAWSYSESVGAGISNYTLNYTNSTMLNGDYNWSCYAWGNGANATSQSWTLTQQAYTAPNLIYSFTSPPTLNLTQFVGSTGVNITYNITSIIGLNVSTAQLWSKVNSTISDVSYYVNGTATTGYIPTAYIDNSSFMFRWNVYDFQLLPGTYNYNESYMERTPHSFNTLSNNDFVSIEILNMSNATQYNFFEIMANSTSIITYYYCNSTYNFASSVATSPNCILYGTETANAQYDHQHSNFSSHHVQPFVINITTGKIGTIVVTPTSYFMIQGNAGAGNQVNYYFINNESRANAMRTSLNTGSSWTNNNTITVDAHVHSLKMNVTTFYQYACISDLNGNSNCTNNNIIPLNLIVSPLPPTSPVVSTPSNSSYNNTIVINYTQSYSPNGYPIVRYNITLLYENFTYFRTITSNNSQNLNYSWNANVLGNFRFGVTAIDNQSQYDTGYSDVFSINKSTPLLVISADTPITYPAISNVAVSGCPSQLSCTLNRNNSIYGAGSWLFNYSTPGNENYTSVETGIIVVVQQNSTYNLGLNVTQNITYPTPVDFAGYGCPSNVTCVLNITTNITYKAQNLTAQYSFAGNENYSAKTAINSVLINKLYPTLTSLLNGGTSNLTLYVPATLNASAYASNGTLNFERNGVDYTSFNGQILNMSQGSYLFKANITGNENISDVPNIYLQADIVKVYTWNLNDSIIASNYSLVQASSIIDTWFYFSSPANVSRIKNNVSRDGLADPSNPTTSSVTFYYVNGSEATVTGSTTTRQPSYGEFSLANPYRDVLINQIKIRVSNPIYSDVYQNGAAVYGNIPMYVNIVSPLNGENLLPDTPINFTTNATNWIAPLVNASLYIDNIYNDTQPATGLVNTTIFTKRLSLGFHQWYVTYCDSDLNCLNSSIGTFSNTATQIISESHTSPVYDTSNETFTLNVQAKGDRPITASITYDGSTYTATKSGNDSSATFTGYLIIPSVTGTTNKSFSWNVYYDGSLNTYANYSQIVNPSLFTICNSTNNVTYVNYVFKDEVTGSFINASLDLLTQYYGIVSANQKTYIFTNTTVNNNYAFCFTPSNKAIQTETKFLQYSNIGYPQRHYYSLTQLSNVSTNVTLYLLSSSSGIYSSVQTITSTGTPIPNVDVKVERQINGNWTQIEQGTSDSSGLATFWLNPNYDHRFTASKSGLGTTTVTIRPTQSVYSIILVGGSSNITFTNKVEGVYYTISPAVGLIQPGYQLFTWNVSAQQNNMVNCKFELTDVNGTVLGSTSSACISNAFLTLNRTISEGDNIYGKYYVDMGEGYILLEGDGNWHSIASNKSSMGTIRSFFVLMADRTAWTDGTEVENKKWEFTIIIIMFLVVAIIAAGLNLGFNYDLYSPGYFLLVLPIFFFIVSASGGLNGEGLLYIEGATGVMGATFPWLNHFMDNYVVAFFSFLIALGVWLRSTRTGN